MYSRIHDDDDGEDITYVARPNLLTCTHPAAMRIEIETPNGLWHTWLNDEIRRVQGPYLLKSNHLQ